MPRVVVLINKILLLEQYILFFFICQHPKGQGHPNIKIAVLGLGKLSKLDENILSLQCKGRGREGF